MARTPEANREHVRKWRSENKDWLAERRMENAARNYALTYARRAEAHAKETPEEKEARKTKQRAYKALWRLAHPEKVKAAAKKWRAKNC